MIPRLWARARYDFGLSSTEFYELTPRQFYFLARAHRERLAHEEMCSAFTTAAVMNTGFCRAEEPCSPLDYMPNHREYATKQASILDTMTAEEQQAESDFNRAVMQARFAQQKAAQNA